VLRSATGLLLSLGTAGLLGCACADLFLRMKRGLRVLAAAGSLSLALSAAGAALGQKTRHS
jgi:hypothetical protein